MFNSLAALPPSLYNIINYLATDKSVEAENLWKMLKYNDYDALNKPNLTTSEKLDMLWRSGPQEKYSIFLTNLIEDALPQSKCVFKLYDYMVQPEGAYVSSVIYAFDFLYGGQMSLVEYDGIPVARGDVFINSILSVLNGVTIINHKNLRASCKQFTVLHLDWRNKDFFAISQIIRNRLIKLKVLFPQYFAVNHRSPRLCLYRPYLLPNIGHSQ